MADPIGAPPPGLVLDKPPLALIPRDSIGSPPPGLKLDRPPGSPTPGGLVDVGGGMVNTGLAALQKTSPVVNERYVPLGPVVADDSELGYGILGSGGPFDPKTQVILRDPQTGKLMGYKRTPATDEGTASAFGHFLMGNMAGPLGNTAPLTSGQRALQAFDQLRIKPSVSVMPNMTSRGLTSGLRVMPGAAGVIGKSEAAMANQTGAAADRIAESLGQAGTPEAAGRTLQTGVERFAGKEPLKSGPTTPAGIISAPAAETSFGTKAQALYNAVPIKDSDLVLPAYTANAFQTLANKFPSSPTLGQLWSPDKFAKSAQALHAAGTLTWGELKLLRNEIGKRIGDPTLVSDIPKSDLKFLYSQMSKDMEETARVAGPDVLKAYKTADAFYAGGMKRIEDQLTSVFNAASPEKAYGQLMAATMKGGDLAKLRAIKRSLAPDEWRDVASTVVDQLGKPTPGAVSLAPEAAKFSVGTMVTNWEKLTPTAKDELFGRASEVRRALDNLSFVSSLQKDLLSARNTSNSATAGIGAATIAGMWMNPKATLSAIAGGYATAKLMTYAPFVRLVTNFASPGQLANQARLVSQIDRATAAAPPEVREDMVRFSAAVKSQLGQLGQRGLRLVEPYLAR